MVEQAAGGSVGGVHGAQEPPGLRQQFAHCGGAQLSKVGAAVDGAEVAQIPAAQMIWGESNGFVLVGAAAGIFHSCEGDERQV